MIGEFYTNLIIDRDGDGKSQFAHKIPPAQNYDDRSQPIAA